MIAPTLSPALEAGVRALALAPSSHNTQPWELLLIKSEAAKSAARAAGWSREEPPILLFCLSRRRSLHALKSYCHEMLMSCGAALENLSVATRAAGADATVYLLKEHAQFNLSSGLYPIALIGLRSHDRSALENDPREEALAIAERVTNRGPYSNERPSAETLDLLLSVESRMKGSIVQHRIIADPQLMGALAKLVAKHAALEFSHRTAWRETYMWMRFSHPENVRDGLAITSFFGPMGPISRSASRIALSPTAMRIGCTFGADKIFAGRLAKLVGSSPAVMALSVRSNSVLDADDIRSGAQLEAVWLKATALGLSLHPISVMTQHDHARTEAEKVLGIGGTLRFLARIGFARHRAVASARRTLRLDDFERL